MEDAWTNNDSRDDADDGDANDDESVVVDDGNAKACNCDTVVYTPRKTRRSA